MKSATPLLCDKLVECVSGTRLPTAPELDSVAERIWSDCRGPRSIVVWATFPAKRPSGRPLCAAHMALCGSAL